MSFCNINWENQLKSEKMKITPPFWDLFDKKSKNQNEQVENQFFNTRIEDPLETIEKPSEASILKNKLEQVEQESYHRGYQEGQKVGFDKGLNESISKLQPHVTLFENVVQALQQEKESFYQENELYIVKLAIEIARKIIQREMTQNPDILLYVVREALKRITDSGRIVIRAHPGDITLIKNDEEFMTNEQIVFQHVDFIPSENITRGGCIIESESGIVDAQLDVQLDRIEQSLLEGADA